MATGGEVTVVVKEAEATVEAMAVATAEARVVATAEARVAAAAAPTQQSQMGVRDP